VASEIEVRQFVRRGLDEAVVAVTHDAAVHDVTIQYQRVSASVPSSTLSDQIAGAIE
jgi:hypothetical protein